MPEGQEREARLVPDKLPRHVAIIMDGNGRWAQKRMRNRVLGHRRGAASVREAVTTCRDLGIPFLTLYAFSQENWNRPKGEVEALMRLLERYLTDELPEMMERDIRMRAIGRLDELPAFVLDKLRETAEKTKDHRALTVTIALSYGGRQEILDAATALLERARRGELDLPLTEETFSEHLYAPDAPDPDLLIRTGGEHRISNFLLWEAAYAELYFTDTLWPDFDRKEFEAALAEYQSRERRFGLVGAQVRTRAVRTLEEARQAGDKTEKHAR
ncbi:MAG: isoprenyl transferase [Candidatus Methylomirabilis sp.]|nr:isoprenyl transferase [Deltaproteobacteria bacterium]